MHYLKHVVMRFGMLVLAVILIGGFIFWKDITGLMVKSEQVKKEEKKKVAPSTNINVLDKWDLHPG
jgi:hypothetical protein